MNNEVLILQILDNNQALTLTNIVLRVNSAAIPLHMIAQVQVVKQLPDLIWLEIAGGIASVAILVLCFAPILGVIFFLIAIMVASIWFCFQAKYWLAVQTAGGTTRGWYSFNKEQSLRVASTIMYAVHNYVAR